MNVKRVDAAVRTWTGTTSGAWSVGSNWSGGTAPVTGDDLVFPNGASNLSNTNDFIENTIFNSITLSGSGYTLSGNPIILGAGLAGITDSVASGGNTIALDVRLDVTRDIVVTNTAETLTISGRIAGVGGVNKEGTGKLVLSGANTFGGTLKINVGVVNAQNDRALGTIAAGTEVVGGAALELQGTINIGYEALALRGYGVSNNGALRNISNNNTFAGFITMGTGGAEIQSDSGTLTITGGMANTATPLIIDGAGDITYAKTPIGIGSGTVTKNGSGTLKYNFPNTYTGLTTINAGTLLYGTDNAILSGGVTVNGGTLDIATYSDMLGGTVTLGTTDLSSGTITGTTGVLSAVTWTLNAGTISAIIAGDGSSVTKATPGTVTLTRPNLYTGVTNISAGILKIQDSTALGLIDGVTTVTSGATLQIDGSGLSVPEYITFSSTGFLYGGAIRNSTGNNTLTGLLTLGAAAQMNADVGTTLTIDTKGLSATTLGLSIGGAGNTTFTSSAPIYGTTAQLIKNDSGVLTVQSFSNFTGATTINRGEVVLSGAGAIPLSTITINTAGTLTLDNTSTTILNRISDSGALTMNGGNFNFKGNTAGTAYETAGALTPASGHNVVTVTPGAGGSTTMTFASLARTAGATVLFRGTNLGSAPAANVSTLMFTTAPTLTGAAGSANSTTISVIKGGFGDESLSGTGTDMVTYNVGNTNGLRLLNDVGFSGEYSTTLTTNTNVKLAATTAASTVSINSLILNGFDITNASATITMASASLSGNILINSANNIAGASTTIGITTNELDILATANSTISAVIGTAVAGSLTLSGSGNVTLSAANAFTGTTSINGATLTYGTSNVLSSGGVTVVNGTYDLNGNSDTVGAVTLQKGTISSGAGVLSGTSYSFREGTVSATLGGGAATVTVVSTGAAPDTVVTISGNNTYTGVTTITSGILKLGAAGNGTNTPLGTTGTGTTIANGGALDLNGLTFSTAEAITSLAGTGFGSSGGSNMGAIMNTNASAATYSGALTLAGATRINADYGAVTISGGISGASALTIGGFSNSTFSGVLSTITSLTKDGIGTLTLSGDNSMAGTTTISLGTIKLGANGGATNTPLGTTAGITSVTAGARLDLAGFTLGTAEPLTLNGVGYSTGNFASGALINSSGSSVTYSGLITLGSASTIKADSGDINLTAAGTITGSGNGLTLGGTGIGTLSSIVGTVAGTVTKIGNGTWTLSGASTYTGVTSIYAGTLKLGATGATTNTPLGVIAGATSVFSGAVLDLNGFTLTAAEPLTTNGRGISDGGAVVNSGGALTYSGAITQATDTRITNSGSGLLTFTGGMATANSIALYIGGTNNITFSTGVLGMGTGTLTKQGSGTVTATGTHTYTGATRVDAGTFAYGSNVTVLAGTNLTVNGGIFDMAASTDTIGTVTLVGGTIQNGTLTATTSYTLESGTISAVLAGAIPVTKNTNNTVTLTGANTISSTTTINAGTLTLSGSGTAVSTTFTINLGGTLTLDNSATNVASRIGDASVITMNGGNFNFSGNTAAIASETIGQLAFASGHNVVTVTPGAGGSTTLTVANNPGFNRTAGATVLFRGTSFGSTPAANVSTLMFTTTPTLTGASGAASSTTISVIKGAFGDSSLSGTGSDMVTYNVGNTNGLRLLNGAGFSGEYAGDLQTANANVKLTANRAAVATNTNSLILNGFDITNPGGAITLPISSASLAGNILINSANNIAGANTTLGITTTELDILATANSTISATIGTATTGSLTLSGTGNITTSVAHPFTSTTFINGATLTYGASNVLSSGGVTMVGGLYNLAGNSDTVGTLSLNAGTITTGAGTLTGNGTFTTIANNNVPSIITGNLGLGANATFTIGDGLMDNDALISAVISGGFTFAKAGNGVLELSGSNTYTGATTISAGTLRLGAAGGATNTPLGTTAAGTTVANGNMLDLNGFTLGTAEALTINGAGVGGPGGAIINTSSTAVTYSGLITLGSSATINASYGTITISNTGSMTGTGFALTLRGAGDGSLATQVNTSTAGSLVKNDLGTWTVSGDSNYTGVTTISAGMLKLGAAGGSTNTVFGTVGGATSITTGAVLDLNGFTLGTAEPITINGTGIANANIGAFINSSNNSISYSGAITLGANSRVVNYGSGVLTLTGAISGNFALTTVTIGGITQSSASVWSGSGTLTKEGSGTLILQGQNTMTGAMTVSTGVLQLGADGGSTNTPFGTIAGGVIVSNGAVLDLSTFTAGGASTWEPITLSGSGLLNGGALISNSTTGSTFGAFGPSTARVVNNGVGTLTIAGGVNSSTPFFVGGSGPITISGALTVNVLLTKYGNGILTLSNAANLNTSLVRINGGTLAYGVADALATPPVTVAGGTLDLKGFNETNLGAVTLIDGSIVNTGGAATLTSTATYTVENGTISAVLGGSVAAGIAKNTAGRVTLSGNNTFTSTSIAVNAGYLNLQNSNALGASGTSLTTTISAGATLELQNTITLPSTKAITANGTGVNNTGAIRNVADSNAIQANITLGTTNVRINSDSGTLTFPTISGNTFNSIFGGAGSTAVTGIISTTSGNLTKDGAGTLTLSGANTYTRPTMILGGTIAANATAALGDGSSTNTLIFDGGTLQATGTITSLSTRAVTLTGNGTIDTNGNSVSIAGTVGSTGGLTKSGAGTLTITGVTAIGGDLTISNGTFVAPTSLTINGNFSNSGTFTHSNGTVTLVPTNSTLTTTIVGSSNTTFYNLTDTTAGSTLQFKAGNTYTFANTLTLTGIEGKPIAINSDTPDAQWLMTLSGSASASYLKVKDSGCSGGNNVGASSTIYNYGNNGACWLFVSVTHGGGGGSIDGSGALGTIVLAGDVITSVTITNGGGGYSTAPVVNFCGVGSGATGTAVLTNGVVTSVTIGAGGSGYNSSSTVVFGSDCPMSGGDGGGSGGGGASTAIATAVVSSNVVQSVTINAGGSGYTSTPTVLFCGGGGSGATGTAVLTNGSVSSVTVNNGGSNYSSVPTVVFNSNCPTTGGSGGGGGGGDIGFLFRPTGRMFASARTLYSVLTFLDKLFLV